MPGWKVLSTEEIYKTPWMRVRKDEVLNHNGKPLTYSVVELKHPSVFILATNSNEQVFFQRVYRYTIDKTLWELPAGHSDGEEPLTAAKRELLEEAGLASDDWVHLGRLYQVAGIGDAPLEAFWAKNAKKVTNELDELEDIGEQKFMDTAEIEDIARRGDTDSPVLAVLYLAKIHGYN